VEAGAYTRQEKWKREKGKKRRRKEIERSLGPVEGAKEDKEKGGGGPPY